jgi:hypothetical protein
MLRHQLVCASPAAGAIHFLPQNPDLAPEINITQALWNGSANQIAGLQSAGHRLWMSQNATWRESATQRMSSPTMAERTTT